MMGCAWEWSRNDVSIFYPTNFSLLKEAGKDHIILAINLQSYSKHTLKVICIVQDEIINYCNFLNTVSTDLKFLIIKI